MIKSYLLPKLRLLPLAALALAGCESEYENRPESGADYFPLEVGRYRIYAVADTVWDAYQRKVSSYQFRETITEQLTDAAGKPGYRIVRARRTLPTDAWRDDSIMVVQATPQAVLLTRNNRRTVELVFPVRADYAWNMNAFAALTPFEPQDSVTNESRRYEQVAAPFEVRSGATTYRYDQTVTTALVDDGFHGFDNEYYLSTHRQVYAKGIGPVYRVRRRFNYCDDQSPTCSRSNTRVYKGQARVETLIEQGKR